MFRTMLRVSARSWSICSIYGRLMEMSIVHGTSLLLYNYRGSQRMPRNLKPIRYVCERCGKRAILGKHFCDDGDVERADFFRERFRYLVLVTVTAFGLSAFFWIFAGSYSLLILLLLPIVIAIMLQ